MSRLLFLSLFLVSCSVLKQPKPIDNQILFTENNLSLLDGEYELFSRDSNKVSLDLSLLLKKYWWGDVDNIKNYKLSLKTEKNEKIQVNIFKNEELIDSQKIRYKIKDGSLVFKRKRIDPFFLILNGYGTMTTRLRLLKSGELLIDHHNFQVVTLVIIPLTGDRVIDYGLVFPKKIPAGNPL